MFKKSSKIVQILVVSIFLLGIGLYSSSAFAGENNEGEGNIDPHDLLCINTVCNGHMVLICHGADSITLALPGEEAIEQAGQCLCVKGAELTEHENHGDVLGECVTSPAS